MVETHVLNFTLLKPIGEISDKKIKIISEKGYTLNRQLISQVAHFTEISTGNNLIIAQNQITYGPTQANVDVLLEDQSSVINMFNLVLDVLLLEGDSLLQIGFERSYDSPTNAVNKSIEMITSPDIISAISSSGVGLRVPFNYDDEIQGEARFEPMFQSPDRYFLGCVLSTTRPRSQSEAETIFKKMIQIINNDLEPTVKRLFEQE